MARRKERLRATLSRTTDRHDPGLRRRRPVPSGRPEQHLRPRPGAPCRDDASPTTAVDIAATNLSVTLPRGSAVLNGSASLSRSIVTADGVTTTTSNVTAPGVTLATVFNSRSASFTLSDLDATCTVESAAGVTGGSQYGGHQTLSGTANGRSFTPTASTTGAASYDATGAPIAGHWTVVRPTAKIAAVVANGLVAITVDDGNDGTFDHAWTFPTAQPEAWAG